MPHLQKGVQKFSDASIVAHALHRICCLNSNGVDSASEKEPNGKKYLDRSRNGQHSKVYRLSKTLI